MTVREMQDEIIRLKKENDICILAHTYQRHDVLEVADFVGDSFALSQKAAKAPHSTVLMCGVRFMAETVKILSPDKKVLLSDGNAGCPMAEQMDKQTLIRLKKQNPDYTVVAYINTTSELKTECDVCVTSSSAVKIIKQLPAKNILFIPDPNLGQYVRKQCPDKNFLFVEGGCPTHYLMTAEEVKQALSLHPNALLLVHPECSPEVTELAHFAGSTSEIMDYAKNSNAKEFIIGTENSITEHLSFELPQKRFYPLSKNCICHNMQLTTLATVYSCVNGTGGEEIELDELTMQGAKRCIDEMLRLG